MRDHDTAMLAYAKLAGLSQSRGQLPPRDRFLLLAGVEALRAGYPQVAERCRELILTNNRHHMVGKFESFAQAAIDTEFLRLHAQIERGCPFEKAEHLLAGLDLTPDPPVLSADLRPGEYALLLLGRSESRTEPLN